MTDFDIQRVTEEKSDTQPQVELITPRNDLVLKDAGLMPNDLDDLDDLVVKSASLAVQPQGSNKASSHTVTLFCDEALVTATDLIYGEVTYPLADVHSLQILNLHRKRSVIQKKLSNFLATIAATLGIVLILSSLPWFMGLVGFVLATASLGYVIYFNWWVEQRRRGEFGLVMTTKLNSEIVITSHSLKAIQALYQVMFPRLDGATHGTVAVAVNMYTGETVNQS